MSNNRGRLNRLQESIVYYVAIEIFVYKEFLRIWDVWHHIKPKTKKPKNKKKRSTIKLYKYDLNFVLKM